MGTKPKTPSQLIRPEIQALSAYHVPDSGNLIKLDAMENPYRWPDELIDQWLESLRSIELNRYPDPAARALTKQLKTVMQVPDTMQLVLGNGSDELIQMLAVALAQPDAWVLAPEPTFVMYRLIAEVAGMNYLGVPLDENFGLDVPAMLDAITKYQPALVFLAYPNNPTGTLFDREAIEEILRAASGLVILDEAYAPFTDASFMSRLGEFNNLLVMRTVSKMGLAGLRLGLLAGPACWLEELDKVRLPYNINVLTQASALFALEHKAMLDDQAAQIRKDRALLAGSMSALPGIQVYSSAANFILFRVPEGKCLDVFDSLREQGVLIKNLAAPQGPLVDCLRVTVGTPQQNQAFMAALQRALN